MTSTDRVMTLLAEANPIPDVHTFERRRLLDAADITAGPKSYSTRGRFPWAIAAAIAVLLTALLIFGTRPSDVDPVDTIPEPTADITPDETESSQPPPSLEGRWQAFSYDLVFEAGQYAVTGAADLAVDIGTYDFEDNELTLVSGEASASCPAGSEAAFAVDLSEGTLELDPIDDECGFERGLGVGTKSLTSNDASNLPASVLDVVRPLDQLSGPGLYGTEQFSPGFSLVLPPGWRFHAGAVPADIDWATGISDNQALIVWRRHNVESPEDLYELFANTEGIEARNQQPASLAGVEGITFDYLSPQPNSLLSVPGIGAGQIVGPPDNIWRTWALDVGGVVVTIVASFTPATVAEKSIEVERILNSITWDG